MLFDRYDGSFLTVVIHETAPDIWGFWSPYFGQKVFVIRFPTLLHLLQPSKILFQDFRGQENVYFFSHYTNCTH